MRHAPLRGSTARARLRRGLPTESCRRGVDRQGSIRRRGRRRRLGGNVPAHRSGGPSLTGALCQKMTFTMRHRVGSYFGTYARSSPGGWPRAPRAQSWAISGPLSTVNGRHRRYLIEHATPPEMRLYAPMSRPSKLAVLALSGGVAALGRLSQRRFVSELLACQSNCQSIGAASGEHLGTPADLTHASAALLCVPEITDTKAVIVSVNLTDA